MLPCDSTGEPLDEVLANLGVDFFRNIGDENSIRAIMLLDAIEPRSAYLLTLPNYTDPA